MLLKLYKYFFVRVANPPAATFLGKFLLFFEIFLFCLRGSDPAVIVFGRISVPFVFSHIGRYLALLSIVIFLKTS